MKYQGGKTRIAKAIADIVTATPGHTYVEPFLGSAATFHLAACKYDRAIGTDAQADIALMWRAAIEGWQPPETLSRDEYAALRHAEPSPLRAFAGHGCSFAGKFFGGYAVEGDRNFAAQARRSILKRATAMRHAEVAQLDYRDIGQIAGPGVVIYCDPPYANTLAYAGAGAFDSDKFWRTMDHWVEQGATVFVSEYAAPDHWRSVWHVERHTSTALNNRGARAVDHLFTR